MDMLHTLPMRCQAWAKPADFKPIPTRYLEPAQQVPCRRARRHARMLPTTCSLSPSPQPLAQESDRGGPGTGQAFQKNEQLQRQGPLTLYPDEGVEDGEQAYDSEDEEEDELAEAGSGSSSGNNPSLTSMLQGTLLPEVFANVHADGSIPQATYTRIRTAEYISSCVDHKACPVPPHRAEFAVVGRSNVGKSSLINMLTGSRRLAKVSKEPGKTQCINHFLINDSWYLVDLPGFGYAKRNSVTRSLFDRFTRSYFLERASLAMVYLLVDCSISPQKVDLKYADWLLKNKVPMAIVFTKADKRKKKGGKHEDNVQAFKHALLHDMAFPALPPCIVTSAEKGYGRTPLLHLTASLRQAFEASGILDKAMLEWQRAQIGATHTVPEERTAIPGAVSSATGGSLSQGNSSGADVQPHLHGSSSGNESSSESISFNATSSGGGMEGVQGKGTSRIGFNEVQGQWESLSSSSSTSGVDLASSGTHNVVSDGSHMVGLDAADSQDGNKGVSSSSSSSSNGSSTISFSSGKPGLTGWSEAEIRARVKQRSLQLKQQQQQQQEIQAKNSEVAFSAGSDTRLEGRKRDSVSRDSPNGRSAEPSKGGKVEGRVSVGSSSSSSSSRRNAGSGSSKRPKSKDK
ncbi:hypothetical protein DUNSADRAFT_14674 [Dunaliella salina]|uniref:EngB-type G domain-containing protein n=1 Tax=Dunaliella salina TaxID=3046 RepID=A0ABQ7G6Y2_DUNSA|nr:hypothetical protein DUNSADRAFT_14674 [Dunaliella salina]|eukprot:KAF5830377.1 hypothetical protein DUNSADRAFT_14674 [Dunaliella salina]